MLFIAILQYKIPPSRLNARQQVHPFYCTFLLPTGKQIQRFAFVILRGYSSYPTHIKRNSIRWRPPEKFHTGRNHSWHIACYFDPQVLRTSTSGPCQGTMRGKILLLRECKSIFLMLHVKLFHPDRNLLLRQGAVSILIGVVGSTLIVMFLTTFLTLSGALGLLPWIIGFNTAMTGFSLVDKTRDALKHRLPASVGAGILNVIMTLGVLTGLSIYVTGTALFGLMDLALLSGLGGLCGAMGGWLAVKYFRLRK
jgi:hypothetical protein